MRESCEEVFGLKTAAMLLRLIELHYTPSHASRLNMAEIDIDVQQLQCLVRCAAWFVIDVSLLVKRRRRV